MSDSRVNLGSGAPVLPEETNFYFGGPEEETGFLFDVDGYQIAPRVDIGGSRGGSSPSAFFPEGFVPLDQTVTQIGGGIGADVISPGGDRFGGNVSGVYVRGETKFPSAAQHYGAPDKVSFGTRGIQPTEFRGYYEPQGGPRVEGYYRPVPFGAPPGVKSDYGIGVSKTWRFEDGGSPLYEAAGRGIGAVVDLPPDYAPMQDVYESRPTDQEAGIGSLIWDTLTGRYSDKGLRESARTGARRSDAIYGGEPTFMDQLIMDYGYPSVYDPALGRYVIPTDRKMYTEAERYARPEGRYDLPSYPELEDARAHMLGSAEVASKYGPRTAARAGKINEFFDWATGQSAADAVMDERNNAVGLQIFQKAGVNASLPQLARMVDSAVFSQLDRILGRTKAEQEAAPEGMSRAPRNFRSPEGGPDLYFPRDERGYFLTKQY